MSRKAKKSAEPLSSAPPGARTVRTAAELAEELGVSVECIESQAEALIRAGACKPVDVFFVGRTMTFSTSAVEKIRDGIAEQMLAAALSGPVPQKSPPAGQRGPRREDLTISRVFPSRNILANLPNGNEVVLTVRRVDHLKAGMVLKACIEGQMGWTYEGRLPRSLGERQLYFPAGAAATKGGQ